MVVLLPVGKLVFTTPVLRGVFSPVDG